MLGSALSALGRRADARPPRGATPARTVALSDLAAESTGESIARENEIVTEIARGDHAPVSAGSPSLEEQLAAQVDADEIRGGADA